MKPLHGKVAVVAGATVYVTGRSNRGKLSPMGRPETIEETAEGLHLVRHQAEKKLPGRETL